jgi:nardilysin
MKSSRARAAAAAAAKPDAAGAARPAEEPVEATEDLLADGPLIVPPQDKKSYRLFVLRNGMRVMVVHDPLVAAAEAAEAAEAAAKARRGTKRRSPADDGGDCDGEGEGDDGSASSGSYEEMSSGEAARVAEEEEEEQQEEDDGESSGSEEEEEEERDGSKGGSGDDAGDDGGRKQAAAALAVGAGSFLDPPGRQGLAHLLEHMLFMGSRRFPSENAYDDYLTRHGGSSNAYTELVRDRLLECRARAGSEEEEKAAHRSPAAGPRVTPSLNPLSNNTPSTQQQKQPTGVHQLPLRGAALRPQGSPRAPRRLLQRPPLLVLLLVARDQSSGFRVCRRAADGPRSAGAAVRGDSEKGPSDAGVCLGQPGVALGRGLCGGDGWWWW